MINLPVTFFSNIKRFFILPVRSSWLSLIRLITWKIWLIILPNRGSDSVNMLEVYIVKPLLFNFNLPRKRSGLLLSKFHIPGSPSIPGSTLYSWFYPLLLVLPPIFGSNLYSWFYPLLKVLPSNPGSPSTPGSTLYSWFYLYSLILILLYSWL